MNLQWHTNYGLLTFTLSLAGIVLCSLGMVNAVINYNAEGFTFFFIADIGILIIAWKMCRELDFLMEQEKNHMVVL